MCNPHHGGCNDREGRCLSPEGPGPEASRDNVCDTCFSKCFQALNNIIKYDVKTNSSIWLEYYCLAGREGGADDDLFVIQFLPI
jgi:hypothetical protein